MRKSAVWVCWVAVLAVVGNKAQADVIYSYTTDSSSYTAATGSSVTVSISLLETLTGDSTSFITAEGGLTGAGAAVNVSGTTGGTAASIPPASFSLASPFTGPSDIVYNQGTGNNLEFTEATALHSEVFPTNHEILLGTLNITVGTGTTTYSLTSLFNDTINNSSSELGQEDGNTTTLNPSPFGTDLDAGGADFTGADAAPGTSFTVAPVPEPGSLSLLGIGSIALLSRRRRRQA